MFERDPALEREEPGHGEVGVPDDAGQGAPEAQTKPGEGRHTRHTMKYEIIFFSDN